MSSELRPREGMVTGASDPALPIVLVGGATTALPVANYSPGYVPQVGDKALVLEVAGTRWLIGSSQPAPALIDFAAAPVFNGSATNVTLTSAEYQVIAGRHVGHCKVTLAGAVTSGGPFRFTLPSVPSLFAGGRAVIGPATLLDSGSNWRSALVVADSSGYAYVDLAGATGAMDFLRSSAPWTWASTDEILCSFDYLPA